MQPGGLVGTEPPNPAVGLRVESELDRSPGALGVLWVLFPDLRAESLLSLHFNASHTSVRTLLLKKQRQGKGGGLVSRGICSQKGLELRPRLSPGAGHSGLC